MCLPLRKAHEEAIGAVSGLDYTVTLKGMKVIKSEKNQPQTRPPDRQPVELTLQLGGR